MSKVLLLVHHRWNSDPRVLLVVDMLLKEGVDSFLLGISPEKYSSKNAHNLPAASLRDMSAMLPRVAIFFLSRHTILQRCLLFIAFLAYCLLFAFLTPAFIGLYGIRGLLGRRKANSCRLFLTLWGAARSYIAPLTYGLEFLRVFSTFYSYVSEQKDLSVIHCNDLETLLVGVYWKSIRKVKLVYDAHEYFPQQASWYKGFAEKVFNRYESVLIHDVDCMVTVNQELAAVFEHKYRLPSGDVKAVPNVFSKSYSVGYKKKESEAPVRFHYMGGFIAERGITQLIEFWKNIPSTKATLHLRGVSSPYKEDCRQLAQELNLIGKSIFFEDPVSEEQLIICASQFDVGIIPYLPVSVNNTNCCPNKLSQYMLAGNAILTQDLPFVRGCVERFENGAIYNYQDEESFRLAVDILCDQQRLESFRANSTKAALEEYNWENHGRVFLKCYKNLLTQSFAE